MIRSLKAIVGAGLSGVLLLAACTHQAVQQKTTVDSTPAPEGKAAVNKLRPDQLKSLLDTNENLFFLDVRSPQEIQELGTLPGYVNIPIDQLEQRLKELPRNKTIVTA